MLYPTELRGQKTNNTIASPISNSIMESGKESVIESGWQFFIDRGGTFTDIIARPPKVSRLTAPLPPEVTRFSDPLDNLLTLKLLSVSPHYNDAALEGIARLTNLFHPQAPITLVKMGTTIATNALLERKGEPTLFVVAEGFRDLLLIGYQTRPDIFARNILRPKPLYDRVIELKTRRDAHGACLKALDETEANTKLKQARRAGLRSVAIALPHACICPQEEQRIGTLAHNLGFEQISLSSEVSPLLKIVPRADTTVLDAYLSPVVQGYVKRLGEKLGNTKLFFMQSNGGLVAKQHCRGKDAVLSGPAGGVVGMVATAQRAFGSKKLRLIGFDMGGTSTDVSHYDGAFERRFETEIDGVRLRTPMLNIRTIAAGGGSVLGFDGLKLRVGPRSAGANPGPACYGRGGPLTLTDCNVLLGRIQATHFPRQFGDSGKDKLDDAVVARKFRSLAREVSRGMAAKGMSNPTLGRSLLSEAEVAAGFVAIANDNMAHAIREISVERGYEVSRYTLQSFGGASGQHACAIADRLGMERILFHPLAALLSAYGMGEAALRALREAQVSAAFGDNAEAVVSAACASLEEAARAQVAPQTVGGESVSLVRKVRLRAVGSDTTLEVAAASALAMRRAYGQAYRRAFGFRAARNEGLVIDSVSLEVVAEKRQVLRRLKEVDASAHTPKAVENVALYLGGAVQEMVDGEWRDCPLYERAGLRAGAQIEGPALITESSSTIVLEPSWVARVCAEGNLVATRVRSSNAKSTRTEVRTPISTLVSTIGTEEQAGNKRRAEEVSRADPVLLEITGNLFRSIAEQMGLTLQNTAHSVNIKERLDFSCALFDAHGNLVANAPHIPVHLGSMSDSIKAVASKHASGMKEGDVYVLNSPYAGGTHLPDITVVRPFFDKAVATQNSVPLVPCFYLAARGHHADIGGLVPGSAPPSSRHIDEEGVLLDNLLLVSGERFLEKEIRKILASGSHPCRSIETNLADLRAQVAATTRGARALTEAIDSFSLGHLILYAGYVQDYGEACIRRCLSTMRLEGSGDFCYRLDNGSRIVVRIVLDAKRGEACIDFGGTSVQDEGNYNAPFSIVRAAVLYVFRTLLDEDIALNDGCLRPLRIVVLEGSMLSPRHPAAVVAGNTEVSQGIVDALYGALGVMASSQGTMNNVIYGNARYQNYETICGGTGAGSDHDGASGVHSHMTNTRMTDLEILESRFPVLLESFCLRSGSGGIGKRRGGDGVVRRLVFLEDSTLSLLSSRRREVPYGLGGGGDGKCGRNVVERADGRVEVLGGNAQTEMGVGDVFVMETPGGGGFGEA